MKRSELTDYEWYRGNLSWMLRPHGQTKVHEFILNCMLTPDVVSPVVINAHRRLGKSFLNVLMAVEDCLRAPGTFAKYICGEKEQVREIVYPLLAQVLVTCPEELAPKVRGVTYTFRNPMWGDKGGYSELKLVGANYKKGDMGRGQACDRAYLDEVRDFKSLRYFVESVLSYQFVGRRAPRLVMTSTLPNTMDHDFTRPADGYVPLAMSQKRYLRIRASENPDYTARDKSLVLSLCPGGEKDASYLREAECELVGDPSMLITPEYVEGREEMFVTHYERPQYFIPMVCMDTAFDPDSTAILFGYLDWVPQLFVFESEVVERRMTTKQIAAAIKEGVRSLGYDKTHYRPKYVADLDPRGIEDLRKDHGLCFIQPSKQNKAAALASFRFRLKDRQIRVLRVCRNLDYQLQNGIWNERQTDYHWSESMGHWDAGQAAIYMCRAASWTFNPNPSLRVQKTGYDRGVSDSWRTAMEKSLYRASPHEHRRLLP
jgi:hypothetical protein